MNLIHYLFAHLAEYGVFVIILAEASGFESGELEMRNIQTAYWFHNPSKGQSPIAFKAENHEILLAIIASLIFVYFSYKQNESNMILINLRRNKNGSVDATEKHFLPNGGLFKYISSPHMTCEVVIFLSLYILLHQNTSSIYLLATVIANQFFFALFTHRWYKENFPEYPKDRRAFVPFLI